MGWLNGAKERWAGFTVLRFYGFKLHLIVNHLGEIISAKLTAANVDDRTPVRELAENLSGRLYGDIEYQCHKYYGEAKVAFLQGVINRLENNPEKFKRLLSKWINYFLRKNSVNENIGIEVRTAKRFALAYAAGVLAIKYKVLPFTREDVMKGVSKCLHDSIQSQQKQNKKIDYWSEILKILMAEGCLDLSDTQKHYSKDEIESANVVSCVVNKIPVLALKSECFDELVPDVRVRKDLLEKLASDGVLIQDSEGKNKRQIPYKGRNMARRYCFVEHRLYQLY